MDYVIQTPMLELIAGTAETVLAEMHNRSRLAELLDAEIPAEWPPDLDGLEMKDLSVRWFENHPDDRGWLCWYFVSLVESRRTLVGIGGFSDVPNAEGTVEAGYSVLPKYQRRGYATEALKALVEWALAHPEVRRVVAEIYPGYESSVRVLEKAGFLLYEEDTSLGITRYEMVKPIPQAS